MIIVAVAAILVVFTGLLCCWACRKGYCSHSKEPKEKVEVKEELHAKYQGALPQSSENAGNYFNYTCVYRTS